jgi:16S rRNA (guanine(966)-N(2))-methyltransferase RsmD
LVTRKPSRGGAAASVRVLAGRWKGRKLDVPAGARPTASRAREALFSMLQDTVPGARVLDLYAGSGAVGLEAASRGAARVVLVEQEGTAIARALERFGAKPAEVALLAEPVSGALSRLRANGERFDLIFCDPPYRTEHTSRLAETVSALLAPGGVFVLQRDRKEAVPELDNLALVRRRDYGRNVLLLYAVSATPCGPL